MTWKRIAAIAATALFALSCGAAGGAPGVAGPPLPSHQRLDPLSSAQALPGAPRTVSVDDLPPAGYCPLDDGRWPAVACTPGASDPLVTQQSLSVTVCSGPDRRGATWLALDDVYLPDVVKLRLMAAENLEGPLGEYVVDRYRPLSLGGSATSPDNLWVMPISGRYGAERKRQDEHVTQGRLCAGLIDLSTAWEMFSAEWSPPAETG